MFDAATAIAQTYLPTIYAVVLILLNLIIKLVFESEKVDMVTKNRGGRTAVGTHVCWLSCRLECCYRRPGLEARIPPIFDLK